MDGIVPTQSITIEVRSVYGQPKAYPVCRKAETFARLTGCKTLTRAALLGAQQLGFEIISIANADWRGVA